MNSNIKQKIGLKTKPTLKKGGKNYVKKEDDPKKVHNPKHTIMLLI